jgi:hypothetical protein
MKKLVNFCFDAKKKKKVYPRLNYSCDLAMCELLISFRIIFLVYKCFLKQIMVISSLYHNIINKTSLMARSNSAGS